MMDYFTIAMICGQSQQAKLLQPRPRDHKKEEDAFYDKAGSSVLVRIATWLTQATDQGAGRARVRLGRDQSACQAARLTRP